MNRRLGKGGRDCTGVPEGGSRRIGGLPTPLAMNTGKNTHPSNCSISNACKISKRKEIFLRKGNMIPRKLVFSFFLHKKRKGKLLPNTRAKSEKGSQLT